MEASDEDNIYGSGVHRVTQYNQALQQQNKLQIDQQLNGSLQSLESFGSDQSLEAMKPRALGKTKKSPKRVFVPAQREPETDEDMLQTEVEESEDQTDTDMIQSESEIELDASSQGLFENI